MKRIVVMGGSFNPPTMAHLKIMQKALDAVGAETGYYVPVSYAYLKRKMAKIGQSHLCLSDELRLKMLEAMTASDSRIRIDTGEMNEAFAVTCKTMERLQRSHPDARICFVAGMDKLTLLEEFQRKWAFLTRYDAIVFRRSTDAAEETEESSLLRDFAQSIVLVDPPQGLEDVSSTGVRKHLFEIDKAAGWLHPAVVPFLRGLRVEDYPEEILQFKGEYAFLSNDWPAEVRFGEVRYPCAESVYLAARFEDPQERKTIAAMSPQKAKQKYNAIPEDPQWQKRRAAVMEHIVRLKFEQHPELAQRLVGTGNRRLLNGGKKSHLWGVNLITWEGDNLLGSILMKIRNEWKEREAKCG